MGSITSGQPGPRRHHYVPRCWLAGFTEDGEKDGRLWVTDLVRRKQWASTPDATGHIRDFYRLSDTAPDPVVVEKFFSLLEDQIAPLLKSIDRQRQRPNSDELDAVLQFMAHQWLRVPSFRPFALRVLERVTREQLGKDLESRETWLAALNKAGLDPNSPGAEYERMLRFFESGEWKITAETDWYIHRAFSDVTGIVECLRERYWQVSFTDRGSLIASDNPVVLEGGKGEMVGFKNAEFVLYPLGRHAFLMGVLDRTSRPVKNFKYFTGVNTMMMLTADAQIYSHVPDFSWLDEHRTHQTDWQLFSKDRF